MKTAFRVWTVIGVAMGVWFLGTRLSRKSQLPRMSRADTDVIDEASKESFPASDAPAWNVSPQQGRR